MGGRVTRCILEIERIQKEITCYQLDNNSLPDDLDDIGLDDLSDPWNNPYEYLPVESAAIDKLRKGYLLVPVNTDFDLFSKGPDGSSVSSFTVEESRDDIVRANNNLFVGVESDYQRR